MKELKDIVAAFDKATQAGKQTALATVVLVEGSAYRRAGARMLITEDGQLTGAISGGCLEGDALRKARLVIQQQESRLVTYDTTDDDDAKMGVGLGCNGIIHILIEPIIESQVNHPIALIKAVIERHKYGVLVTIFSLQQKNAIQTGTCLCLADEKIMMGNSVLGNHQLSIINEAKSALQRRSSSLKVFSDDVTYTIFTEVIKPVISMVIVGAGNDAIPLIKMANVLGWDVTVADGRSNYATKERFPQANAVIVAKPDELLSQVDVHEATAFVLMTHNYNYELALLKSLAARQFNYVGILGPKKKLERLLAELKDNQVLFSEEQLDRIYGPVGLDIGSEGAEEISLSILSEIKAVLSSRKGYSLKFKPEPIHAFELESNASL